MIRYAYIIVWKFQGKVCVYQESLFRVFGDWDQL